MFSKSLSYSHSYGTSGNYKYMFITEVVVGKHYDCDSENNTNELPSGYNSVKAVGNTYPNPK